jgi:hypothetical protein
MKIKNKLRLYLDDIRTPVHEDWIVVRDFDEFVYEIKLNGLGNFELISLDHDLGDTAMVEYYTNVKNNHIIDYNNIKEKTGLDAAKFLVSESMNSKIPLPQIYVHSANPIGSDNIIVYINNYLKNCNYPDTCVRVQIEHTIDPSLLLTPEERKSRWDRSENN